MPRKPLQPGEPWPGDDDSENNKELEKFLQRKGSFQNKFTHWKPRLDESLEQILALQYEKAWNAGQAPKDLLAEYLAPKGKAINDLLAQVRMAREELDEEEEEL